MTDEPDLLVDVVRVAHGFEAETIAESLQSRGIAARAFTTVGDTLQWEAGIKPSCVVQVPRSQFRAAQIALASIKSGSVDIDWDELFGPEPAAPPEIPAQARRGPSKMKVVGLVLLILFGTPLVIGLAAVIVAVARHALLEPR